MKLPAISLSRGELGFDEAARKEWLVVNGLGGYASSTVLGLNTRKYHGLLVSALHPPADRTVCLSKLDDEVVTENTAYPLHSNEFENSIFPQGHLFLKAFSVSPFPKYCYTTEAVEVEKTIFMPNGRNAVATLYKIQARNQSSAFRIHPLLNFRHYHSVTNMKKRETDVLQKSNQNRVEVATIDPQVTVILLATEGEFKKRPALIERLFYREEAARMESCFDDCYLPGFFEVQVMPNQMKTFAIVAAAEEDRNAALAALEATGETTNAVNMLFENKMSTKIQTAERFCNQHERVCGNNWLGWIIQAADTFVVTNAIDSRSIIAGYHWFETWGRDTFISLPGLTLATGRNEDAKRILLGSAKHLRNGIVPNYVSDKASEPVYNTADSTLWFVNAVLQYLGYTGDFEFVRTHLWEKLKEILEHHIKGTEYGIHVDQDGLLAHGPQLTWMDCQVDGKPVTPRGGKAVEIQALWYNALRTMQFLADRFGEKRIAQSCSSLAERTRESFNRKFWNPEKKCFFDTINEWSVETAIRPNQIICASLHYSMINRDKAESMIDVVRRELATPYGLRTLARSEPEYVGVYAGERRKRDQAYHNGTIWPWLLGPFVSAYLKTKGYSKQNRETVFMLFLEPLLSQQIHQAGLGAISEIFDGEPPHTPRGCISQAWSVAEPLRAYLEDVLQIRPKYEEQVLAP